MLNLSGTNIIIGLVSFSVLLLIIFLVLYKMSNKNASMIMSEEEFERFEPEQEKIEEENEHTPQVDAATGSVMDGPGFEENELEGAAEITNTSIPSNYYFLDDGANGEMSIQHNLCSKSCCSEQWPTPFKTKYDPYVCENKDKFVPSRIFCNNTFQDSGCLCLSKDQARHIYNRGGNGREWF